MIFSENRLTAFETKSASALPGDALRVLFVDDQADLRLMMRVLLTRHSYHVETAAKAHEALQIAPEFKPHIVVSDIGMPDMNGCEMMRELRGDARLRPFKAVALTGYSDSADQNTALESGFDHCLVKPIDTDFLISTLQKLALDLSSEYDS